MWRVCSVLAVLALNAVRAQRPPVVEYENTQSPCYDAQGRSQVSPQQVSLGDIPLPREPLRCCARLSFTTSCFQCIDQPTLTQLRPLTSHSRLLF